MNRLIILVLTMLLAINPVAAQEQEQAATPVVSCTHTDECEAWNGPDDIDLGDLDDETLILEALENHKPTCWQSTQACCAACWVLCKIKAGEFGDHIKEHKTAYGILGTAACIGILAYFIYSRVK